MLSTVSSQFSHLPRLELFLRAGQVLATDVCGVFIYLFLRFLLQCDVTHLIQICEPQRRSRRGFKNSATSVSSSVLFFNQELEILLVPGRR